MSSCSGCHPFLWLAICCWWLWWVVLWNAGLLLQHLFGRTNFFCDQFVVSQNCEFVSNVTTIAKNSFAVDFAAIFNWVGAEAHNGCEKTGVSSSVVKWLSCVRFETTLPVDAHCNLLHLFSADAQKSGGPERSCFRWCQGWRHLNSYFQLYCCFTMTVIFCSVGDSVLSGVKQLACLHNYRISVSAEVGEIFPVLSLSYGAFTQIMQTELTLSPPKKIGQFQDTFHECCSHLWFERGGGRDTISECKTKTHLFLGSVSARGGQRFNLGQGRSVGIRKNCPWLSRRSSCVLVTLRALLGAEAGLIRNPLESPHWIYLQPVGLSSWWNTTMGFKIAAFWWNDRHSKSDLLRGLGTSQVQDPRGRKQKQIDSRQNKLLARLTQVCVFLCAPFSNTPWWTEQVAERSKGSFECLCFFPWSDQDSVVAVAFQLMASLRSSHQ